MNGRAWAESELHFLRENYGKLRPAEIARALKRGSPSVRGMAYRLGLTQKGQKDRKPRNCRVRHQRRQCPICGRRHFGSRMCWKCKREVLDRDR